MDRPHHIFFRGSKSIGRGWVLRLSKAIMAKTNPKWVKVDVAVEFLRNELDWR